MSFEWVEINIESDEGGAEIAAQLLILLGCSGAAEEMVGESVLVRGYLPSDEQMVERIDYLYERLEVARREGLSFREPRISTRLVSSEEWDEYWRDYFVPLTIGSCFLIKPSWRELNQPTNRIILDIDAAGGFGTGHHPTTRMCLELLESCEVAGKRVLDIGCGSGILSVAAAKLRAREVLAVDIEESALYCTRRNAERNEVANIVRVQRSDLLSTVTGRFDLVLANLVTETVLRLLPRVRETNLLSCGGLLITSGISQERCEWVERSAQKCGLNIIKRICEEGWSALVCARKSLR